MPLGATKKLAQTLETNTSNNDKYTEYVGGTIYVDGQPVTVGTPEGRLVPDGSGNWRHEYFLKDHLGNTRAVVAGTLLPGTADVLQTIGYYPFGLTMAQTDYNTLLANYHENRYLYNGKELQTEGSQSVELGWLDYGARMYDPSLGRWHVVDPLAELQSGINPYHYCYNNPINLVDRHGLSPDDPQELVQRQLDSWQRSKDMKNFEKEMGDFGRDSHPSMAPIMAGEGEEDPPSGKKNGSGQKSVEGSDTENISGVDVISGAAMQAGGGPLEDMKKYPPKHPEYESPIGGDRKVKNPNGRGSGWIDNKGRVWVPDDHGGTHAPHWDRQEPKGGGYIPVYPIHKLSPKPSLRDKISEEIGLSGAALTIYIIISEGSRLFPPRNLIPVP